MGIGTSSPSYPLDINSTSVNSDAPAFNIGSNAYHNLVTEGIWGSGSDNGYLSIFTNGYHTTPYVHFGYSGDLGNYIGGDT